VEYLISGIKMNKVANWLHSHLSPHNLQVISLSKEVALNFAMQENAY